MAENNKDTKEITIDFQWELTVTGNLIGFPSYFFLVVTQCIAEIREYRDLRHTYSTYTCKHTVHACMYTYIHTYIHTYTHTYIYKYIHTYIQTNKQTYIHTYIHTYSVYVSTDILETSS